MSGCASGEAALSLLRDPKVELAKRIEVALNWAVVPFGFPPFFNQVREHLCRADARKARQRVKVRASDECVRSGEREGRKALIVGSLAHVCRLYLQ